MNSVRLSTLVTLAFSIVGISCYGEPTCDDLATCPYVPGSSSGQTSSSSSSSGAPLVPEICENGVDDDGNGAIDCADIACSQAFTCVPAIPTGFSEIVTMTVADYGSPTSPCIDGTNPRTFYQNPAQDTCDACGCDISGVTCTPAPLLVTNIFNKTCTNPQMTGAITPGQCLSLSAGSAIVKTNPTPNGTCKPQAVTQPLLPPMAIALSTCSVATNGGEGCGTGSTCVPSAPLNGAEYLCVQQSGHKTCPEDWPVAIHAFDSFLDDRQGCTPCGCTATCTGGEYTAYPGDGTCTIAGKSLSPPGTCVIGNIGVSGMGFKMSPLSASCTSTPGTMSGSVQPQNETTFCCR